MEEYVSFPFSELGEVILFPCAQKKYAHSLGRLKKEHKTTVELVQEQKSFLVTSNIRRGGRAEGLASIQKAHATGKHILDPLIYLTETKVAQGHMPLQTNKFQQIMAFGC